MTSICILAAVASFFVGFLLGDILVEKQLLGFIRRDIETGVITVNIKEVD